MRTYLNYVVDHSRQGEEYKKECKQALDEFNKITDQSKVQDFMLKFKDGKDQKTMAWAKGFTEKVTASKTAKQGIVQNYFTRSDKSSMRACRR